MLKPIHPGEILADELNEMGVSATELARQIGVPPNRITQIVHAQRGMTGDTAVRLGHWFDMNPEFWMNLQTGYEIAVARQAIGDKLAAMPKRQVA